MRINNNSKLEFVLRLKNPNVDGVTSPFKFTMYYNNNVYMYDNTTCNATITNINVPDYTRPQPLSLTNNYINQATDVNFLLPIVIKSNVVIITFPR